MNSLGNFTRLHLRNCALAICIFAVGQLLLSTCVAQRAFVPPVLLRPGINLGRFLDGVKVTSHPCCEKKDLDIINNMGFKHVRILVQPGQMFNFTNPSAIEGKSLQALDEIVNYCVTTLKVGVILSIDLDEDRFKDKLTTDKDFPGQFSVFWESFARHYSQPQFPADLIFFETKNEPGLNENSLTDAQWRDIQANLAMQIRTVAQNTIIATGAQNSDILGLLALPPLKVDHVIYLFHYYEPYSFTHQGETWNDNYAKFLKDQHVRYPYAAEGARTAADQVPDLVQRLFALHDMEGATKDRIESDMYIVAEWARLHSVTVICDEFGVIRSNPQPQDRAQWIGDVKTLLERYGFGWTFWDYGSDSFGLAHGPNQFDEGVKEALGVTAP